MTAQRHHSRRTDHRSLSEFAWTMLFAASGAAGLAALLAGPVLKHTDNMNQLERVLTSNQLVVVTRNSPATFFFDTAGYTGLEYELSRRFAESLNVELKIRSSDSFAELLPAVVGGEADIAAASISVTPARKAMVRFGPAYKQVTQQVIYRAGQKRPRKVGDLVGGKLSVLGGSSYAENVQLLAAEHPDLVWAEVDEVDVETLLQELSEGHIDFTVVDSNIFEVYRRFYPKLRAGFTLTEPQPIAWAFAPGEDNSLLDEVTLFFESLQQSGELESIIGHHYHYVRNYDQVSTHYYLRHIDARLPQLEPAFRSAAKQRNLDWRLLAAIGYQESHWDPAAVSPTGVKGIMMLTSATANQLGLTDRVDPQESIRGGAQYLRMMLDKIPERITGPDQTWLALAAYNIGYGHLEDARVLTQSGGRNPDSWADVREFLPLLSQKKWYSKTRYGYARGKEPVQYVQQIRSYLDILRWVNSRPEKRVVDSASLGSSDVAPAPPP